MKNLRKHLYRVFEFNNTGNYPEYVLGYLSMVTVVRFYLSKAGSIAPYELE